MILRNPENCNLMWEKEVNLLQTDAWSKFEFLTGASILRSFMLLRDGDISAMGKLLTRCAFRSLTQPQI